MKKIIFVKPMNIVAFQILGIILYNQNTIIPMEIVNGLLPIGIILIKIRLLKSLERIVAELYLQILLSAEITVQMIAISNHAKKQESNLIRRDFHGICLNLLLS